MSEKEINKIIKDLQYIYPAISIPIYLYRGENVIHSFPEQSSLLYPPEKYHKPLQESSMISAILSTSFFAEYGILWLNREEKIYLIIGPTAPFQYSTANLNTIFHEFSILKEDRATAVSFLDGIPNLAFTSLRNIIKMLHYFLNGEENLTIDALTSSESETQLEEKYTTELFNDKEYHVPNNSLELERIVSKIIESGDVAQLKKGVSHPYANMGTLSSNTLRHMKNHFIVYITLLTRSAIRGGVNPSEAFKLSDLYIQKVESMETLAQVDQLFTESATTLTTFVAQAKQIAVKTSNINDIINYVRQHTNSPLTVTKLAQYFGYSNNYLSTKFKKELGFPLSTFITRTKLEEAKLLLKYTDKSLLDISEYLYFSSQSHFQNAFKKQYGITPLQYRMDA